jgi:hypothetical protein
MVHKGKKLNLANWPKSPLRLNCTFFLEETKLCQLALQRQLLREGHFIYMLCVLVLEHKVLPYNARQYTPIES